jgi:hypothetical protein
LDLRDKIDHSVSSAADKLGEIGKWLYILTDGMYE